MARYLYEVAEDIKQNWPEVYFGAVPYLKAMAQMDDVDEPYGLDSGRSIVLYFLANSRGFKGPDARRIKAELKQMLETK
jgi:hypothetical protein